jgi:RNA polymerase sigma-70 factor (ECF subfamily)
MHNNETGEPVKQSQAADDEDYELIRKFIDGDEKAFKTLLMKHKDKVRNLVFLTLSNREVVDDIAQDVFITVFNKLKDFRFESLFTTWLYRVTVNKCKDYLRKVQIRSIFVPIKEGDSDIPVKQFSQDTDITAIVRSAIDRLPEKLREPLMLREIDGFSYKEIADQMNLEVGTIKSRIFRARECLKALLQPYEKDLMV